MTSPRKPINTLDAESGKVIPFFVSNDVRRSRDFYSNILGMKSGPLWPESATIPGFCSVFIGAKAAVNIYIRRQDEDRSRPPGHCMVMLKTLDGLAMFKTELVQKGMREKHSNEKLNDGEAWIGPTEDMEWGYRQFDLCDPDGNTIAFFAFLEED